LTLLSLLPFASKPKIQKRRPEAGGTKAGRPRRRIDQWRDRAKFLRRARRAVPLLKYFRRLSLLPSPRASVSPWLAMLKLIETNAWPLALTSLVQFVLFLRWIYRRIRNDELMRAFVEDMAMNHLPHMYDLLEKLCDKQGIDRDPAPPIRWIDLSDRNN
jgi:hypothetical protein